MPRLLVLGTAPGGIKSLVHGTIGGLLEAPGGGVHGGIGKRGLGAPESTNGYVLRDIEVLILASLGEVYPHLVKCSGRFEVDHRERFRPGCYEPM